MVSVDQTTLDCAPAVRKNSADLGNLSWSVSYSSCVNCVATEQYVGMLFSDDVASQMILMGVRTISFSTRRHASEDCVKDGDMHE